MEKKVKVFFIINCFSFGGGAESLLTTIVNNLNPCKYDIGIMEIIHDYIKEEPIKPYIKMYPYYTLADAPDRKARMYYVYHEWDRVIDEYIPKDYDIYVSFNYMKPSFLLPKGKKNIAWIHGDVYNLLADNKNEEKELQRKAFKKATRIVSISDITTKSIIDLYPEFAEKVRVIFNGVDIDRIIEKSQEKTSVEIKHPSILSVGRLDKNKNPMRLLHIFEKVHAVRPSTHLYFLGSGELENDVRVESVKLDLADYVHLLGYHQNPFPIIKQCDVVGMFSLSEGFPMALLEGVALGKPFVSSVIGGSGILADEQKCGKTVESDDEAVEAFLYFFDMDKEIIKENCDGSMQRFKLNKYISKIENLFDEVLREE